MSDTVFKLNRVESRGAIALVTIDNGEDHRRPTTLGRPALGVGGRGDRAARAGDLGRGGDHRKALRLLCRRRHRRVHAHRVRRRGNRRLARRARALRPHPLAAVSHRRGDQRGVPRWRPRARAPLHRAHDRRRRASRRLPRGVPVAHPAWGGTQLAPRLAGPAAAVEAIVAEPAATEHAPLRGRGGRARSRRPPARTRRVRRRLARVCGRARRLRRHRASASGLVGARHDRAPDAFADRRRGARRDAGAVCRARPDRRRRDSLPRRGLRRGGGCDGRADD